MTAKITSTGITFSDSTVATTRSEMLGPSGPPGPPGPQPFSCACFLDGTKVLMANGSEKNIEDVKIGEMIACHFNPNGAQVLGRRAGRVRGNNMYLINNNLITTGEHRFYTRKGTWVAVDLAEKVNFNQENCGWREVANDDMNSIHVWNLPKGLDATQMNIGDKLVVGDKDVVVNSIVPIDVNPNDKVQTLITGSSMIIQGGIVVGGWTASWYEEGQDVNRYLKEVTNQIDKTGKWL